jgi:hypothetical protein
MPAVSIHAKASMSPFTRLKKFLFNRRIGKYHQTNLSRVPENHFSAINSVGIIFDATDSKVSSIVLAFVDQLRKKEFEVWPFGFFNSRNPGTPVTFDFIDLKQLSFAWIPEGERIQKFIDTPFDVLINLDTSAHRPLNYIAAASKALFKIGPAHGNHAHYDLMVEMHGSDLERYIQEIRTTFNKIQG